jgi:N-acetylated-alpha-linked acidic dipeptidase
MNEVARDVTDPQTKISVLERRQSRDILSAANAKAKKELLAKKTISLGALGSGSELFTIYSTPRYFMLQSWFRW